MVKRQKIVFFAGFFPALLGLVFSALMVMAGEEKKTPNHPQLSEQEMLIDCAACHRETTPAVEKEWFNSVHGLAMVKCYQCHGSFENFAVTPTKQTCGTCHADMLQKCPQDRLCWECHVPHAFKNKK